MLYWIEKPSNTGIEMKLQTLVGILICTTPAFGASHIPSLLDEISSLKREVTRLEQENFTAWKMYHDDMENNQRKVDDLLAKNIELTQLLEEERSTVLYLSRKYLEPIE